MGCPNGEILSTRKKQALLRNMCEPITYPCSLSFSWLYSWVLYQKKDILTNGLQKSVSKHQPVIHIHVWVWLFLRCTYLT